MATNKRFTFRERKDFQFAERSASERQRWEKLWGAQEVYTWQAVLLSLDRLPPDSFEQVQQDATFKDRYWILHAEGPMPSLGAHEKNTARIQPHAFVSWVEKKGWPLPEGVQKLLGRTIVEPSAKWPWGDYETDALRALAAAVEKYWPDPKEASALTAPLRGEVENFLKSRPNIDDDVAAAIYKVIAGKAPKGRPTKVRAEGAAKRGYIGEPTASPGALKLRKRRA